MVLEREDDSNAMSESGNYRRETAVKNNDDVFWFKVTWCLRSDGVSLILGTWQSIAHFVSGWAGE